jgi:hypothetical protein
MVQHRFNIEDHPFENVVVYRNGAEVTRSLKLILKKGDNEIIISNLTDNIEPDSFKY